MKNSTTGHLDPANSTPDEPTDRVDLAPETQGHGNHQAPGASSSRTRADGGRGLPPDTFWVCPPCRTNAQGHSVCYSCGEGEPDYTCWDCRVSNCENCNAPENGRPFCADEKACWARMDVNDASPRCPDCEEKHPIE